MLQVQLQVLSVIVDGLLLLEQHLRHQHGHIRIRDVSGDRERVNRMNSRHDRREIRDRRWRQQLLGNGILRSGGPSLWRAFAAALADRFAAFFFGSSTFIAQRTSDDELINLHPQPNY